MFDWFNPAHWLDAMLDWLAGGFLNAFDAILAAIVRGLLVNPDVTGLPQIQELTRRSVLVVDSVFVLAFLAAGALTMVSGGNERSRYTLKDLMPRLVVGFIAAHFSQLFIGQAVGLANGLVAGLTPGDTNRPGALEAMKAHVHAASDKTVPMLFAVIAAIITVLLATTTMSMLVRFAALLVLATAAPLALACHALPQTDPVARLWWRSFGGCLAIPVLQAFTLQAGQWMLEDPAHLLPELGLPMDPGAIVNMFIVIVLLWTTVKIPGLVRRYVTQGGRNPNFLGMIIRVVVVQQLTRGLGRGVGRGVRTVAR
jgi:hypothetical protein